LDHGDVKNMVAKVEDGKIVLAAEDAKETK